MRKMKRKGRLAPAFLLVLLMSALPAFAAAASAAGGQEEVPLVEFENEANRTPDLYVKKEVTADAGVQIPDALFRFTLQVNGTAHAGQKYRVLGADGKEICRVYTDGTYTEMPADEFAVSGGARVDFTTDRNGSFTLRAGQTAWFETVRGGDRFVVTEGEAVLPEGAEGSFTQTVPEGGAPADGTVESEGTEVRFVNSYREPYTPPPGPGPDPETETVTLTVEKKVRYPEGYALPETPGFVFRLQVNSGTSLQPWAEQPYTVTGGGEGTQQLTTDAEGRFTLKAGQKASFAGVPSGRDYRVEELLEEAADGGESPASLGWRVMGDAVKDGGTLTSPDVTFYNEIVSFAVAKKMSDGSTPDEDFTFRLTHGDGSVWPDAAYYLYDEDKQLAGGGSLLRTDADGRFALRAGQTAVFVGIGRNTRYNVQEELKEGYRLVLPSGDDRGYMDQTVDGGVSPLPFENRPDEESSGSLKVTKKVEAEAGVVPAAGEEFTFVLLKEAAGGYEPVTGAVYYVQSGGSEYSYKTGEDGSFRLSANRTAEFRELPEGGYLIKETDLPAGYRIKKDAGWSDAQEGWTVSLDGRGSESLTCTNAYTPVHGLTVSKQVEGSAGDRTKAFGFTLTLEAGEDGSLPDGVTYRKTGADGQTWEGTPAEAGTGEADGLPEISAREDGKISYAFTLAHGESITFGNIPMGTPYSVTETELGGYRTEAAVDGAAVTGETASGTLGNADTAVSFTNSRDLLFPAPPTGGPGTALLYAAGIVLILAGAGTLAVVFRKRKKA